jgi:RNA polymerase sigma-70 factor (ECF subfamily)
VPEPFDADWRQRALDGDEDAVRLLADFALGPLYRFCLHRIGGDRHLCEEVVQETLLRALRALEDYDPLRSGGRVFPWLTGLARNEIRRTLARERHSPHWRAIWTKVDNNLLSELARIDGGPFSEAALEREETGRLVRAALDQLPPHYRETLEAKYLDSRSVRDIAADRAVSEKTVESLLTRARQAFRAVFLALADGLGGGMAGGLGTRISPIEPAGDTPPAG